MLWFMGSQRVGHERATELNCTELISLSTKSPGIILSIATRTM